MKKMIYRFLLGIGALLMFFRFGGPAMVFGTTGPGPVGQTWVASGNETTLLLDADLRFFGAMMLGTGMLMIWLMREIEHGAAVLRIVAGTMLVGAMVRIYALVQFGSAGNAGVIPIVIEIVLPIALVVLHGLIRREEAPG